MPAIQVPFRRRLRNRGTWNGYMSLLQATFGFITTVSPRLFCLPFHSNTDSSQSATGVRPQCCLQSTRVKIDADHSQKSPRLSSTTNSSIKYFMMVYSGLEKSDVLCEVSFPNSTSVRSVRSSMPLSLKRSNSTRQIRVQ
jgi:hypothetical protein